MKCTNLTRSVFFFKKSPYILRLKVFGIDRSQMKIFQSSGFQLQFPIFCLCDFNYFNYYSKHKPNYSNDFTNPTLTYKELIKKILEIKHGVMLLHKQISSESCGIKYPYVRNHLIAVILFPVNNWKISLIDKAERFSFLSNLFFHPRLPYQLIENHSIFYQETWFNTKLYAPI